MKTKLLYLTIAAVLLALASCSKKTQPKQSAKVYTEILYI